MIFRVLLIGSLFLINTFIVMAQKAWQEIRSVEDLCTSYPAAMSEMLQSLDLARPGLEKVKSSYDQGKLVAACEHLLAYYNASDNAQHLRRELPPQTNKTVVAADTTLADIFIVQNVKAKIPYLDDGHRDWYYKGPNTDREWAWLSNRHSQILDLFNVYFETGNPKYVEYIDAFLRDFIIKSWPYPAVKSSTSVWRGLEVAARAKVWSRLFYGLLSSDLLSPATRLLILSSLPDHAHYNRNFHGGNNWLTMEISALATIATNFPEYKGAKEWLDYSINTMVESMKGQVYPDGVQTELTSHYHNVALFNFELFKSICDEAGRELPGFFNQTIYDMYAYMAFRVRPDGFRILNNDGDLGSDREYILRAAEKYQQPAWKYIATNGNSGTKPVDGPSYFYPWAGQLISRSGFEADAHWSFFDLGPWGSGHQHNDKLHLSIAAFGRDLLVDAGRFAYTGETAEKFRPYARSTAAHNLILIDGKGQAAGPTHATEPVGENHIKITPDFDYASNSMANFIDVEGEATHHRSLFYVRGEFWVVVDRIFTDRPRKIETLWHWHPSCIVEKEGKAVKTNNEKGNLLILPASGQNLKVELIKGQVEPAMQGWYSSEYNIYEPNITTQYTSDINGNSTLVWLLVPAEGATPKATVKILSENESEVEVEVRTKGQSWDIKIPYTMVGNTEGPTLTKGI
jgi:hypothetical protein